jgi:thiopurine S-methyltransferase
MDPDFWLERWKLSDIGFHQPKVQPALALHWAGLGVAQDTAVLVPLCGKSLDLVWLAGQGYRIIGAELSELAVDAFFSEHGLTPDVKTIDGFVVKSASAYELWCGDFFALRPQHVPAIQAAYDRAALVAMPPALQPRYAAKLAELLKPDAPMLLIGLDYNADEMQGPPFSTPPSQVNTLFAEAFDVALIDRHDGLAKSQHLAKRGVTRLEEASYLLRRRA